MLHNAYHKCLIKCQSYKLLKINNSKYKVELNVFQCSYENNAVCNCASISAVIEPAVQRTDGQASSMFECA